MTYPIAIHKDPKTAYGVTVPDLPGCFSGGETLDEALANARGAIELHLEGMIEDGEAIVDARSIDEHQHDRDLTDAVWAVVEIDLSKLPLKAERINITMPKRILDAVDRYARANGETRSGLLMKAASKYIGTGEKCLPDLNREKTVGPAKRRRHRKAS